MHSVQLCAFNFGKNTLCLFIFSLHYILAEYSVLSNMKRRMRVQPLTVSSAYGEVKEAQTMNFCTLLEIISALMLFFHSSDSFSVSSWNICLLLLLNITKSCPLFATWWTAAHWSLPCPSPASGAGFKLKSIGLVCWPTPPHHLSFIALFCLPSLPIS